MGGARDAAQTPPIILLTAEVDARTITVTIVSDDPLSGGSEPASGVTRWAVVSGTTAPTRDSLAWKTVPPTTFRLLTGNGDKTISAFSRDAAGNVSVAASVSVAVDIPAPSLTITLPAATITRPPGWPCEPRIGSADSSVAGRAGALEAVRWIRAPLGAPVM